MKRKAKIFWIFYILWSIVNIALLVMAVNNTFGEFDKTTEKFWPFTVGCLNSYDFLELSVYLVIPLAIHFLTKYVRLYHLVKEEDTE